MGCVVSEVCSIQYQACTIEKQVRHRQTVAVCYAVCVTDKCLMHNTGLLGPCQVCIQYIYLLPEYYVCVFDLNACHSILGAGWVLVDCCYADVAGTGT